MTPQRIQRKRTKGWQMPPNTVYVGRPTKWGNPFTVGKDLGDETVVPTAKEAVGLFEYFLPERIDDFDMTPEEYLEPLRGKDLACWCPLDQPCHADVLLRLANEVKP